MHACIDKHTCSDKHTYLINIHVYIYNIDKHTCIGNDSMLSRPRYIYIYIYIYQMHNYNTLAIYSYTLLLACSRLEGAGAERLAPEG